VDHQPEAAVIVPPRATAVPNATAASEPTQRDRHLQSIAEKGRIGWQKMSGYNKRSRVETATGRYKQVIGDGLRSRKDQRQTTEVGVSVHVLNWMLELGRPDCVPRRAPPPNAKQAHPAKESAPVRYRGSARGRNRSRRRSINIFEAKPHG
jgi:hypothetical protein